MFSAVRAVSVLCCHPLPAEPSSFPWSGGCLPALPRRRSLLDRCSSPAPCDHTPLWLPVPEAAWQLRFAEGRSVTFVACRVITCPARRGERVCFTCRGR